MKRTMLLILTLSLLVAVTPVANVHAGRGLSVNIANGGTVDNEVVNMSKSAQDEIVWYSEGHNFIVSFPTSPFAASTFHVPAGGNVSSGPVRSKAALGQYPYFILDESTGQSADPGLNIKP